MNKLELGRELVRLADELVKEEMHEVDYNKHKVKQKMSRLTEREFEAIAMDAIIDVSAMFR